VHGQVYPLCEQCFFKFFGENTLASDDGERGIFHHITRSFDDLDGNSFMRVKLSETLSNPLGLPECEF
jgi:hypothetical protein